MIRQHRPVPLIATPCPHCGAELFADRNARATARRRPIACPECQREVRVIERALWASAPAPDSERAIATVSIRTVGAAVAMVVAIAVGLPLLCVGPFAYTLLGRQPAVSATVPPPSPPTTFEEACDQDQGRQCYQAGYAYEHGQGRPKDQKRGASYYRRACELKYPEGCTNLGWAYENGFGLAHDLERAFQLYNQACELQSAAGCNNLARAFATGRGTPEDPVRGAGLFDKACTMGSALACNEAALTAADNPRLKDAPEEVTELFRLSCNRGHGEGCKNLAHRYLTGDGAEQDAEEARALYEKACSLGVTSACSGPPSLPSP